MIPSYVGIVRRELIHTHSGTGSNNAKLKGLVHSLINYEKVDQKLWLSI